MSEALEYGGVVLDVTEEKARRGEIPLKLSPREFDLITFFMLRPQRLLSTKTIREEAWPGEYVTVESMRFYISQLRKKLGHPALIRSKPGQGYILMEG